MKILISINSYKVGGGQIFAIRLANYLSQYHDVILYDQDPDIRDQRVYNMVDPKVRQLSFFHRRIEHIVYNKLIKKLPNSGQLIALLRKQKFRYVLKRCRPDVVNSHVIGSDISVIDAKPDTPVVISMHGCYESMYQRNGGNMNGIDKVLLAADGVIYAADKNISLFQHTSLSRLNPVKIYYGFEKTPVKVQSRGRLHIPEAALVFGMAARSIPTKGWVETLAAFEKLQQHNPDRDVRLLILCDETEFYQELKQRYHHNPHIYFLGYTQNTLEWIPLFDVALLPTYFPGESLPNTIIEYLACGKPVITTRIGEIEAMIRDADGNEAGIAIPLNSTHKVNTEDIYNAMSEMLHYSEGDRYELANTARAASEKFSFAICADRYINYYQSVIDNIRDIRQNSVKSAGA